jgi:hypothetical protein
MKLYSQSNSEQFQESFVISILDEKRNGYYVEIGSGHPTKGNNTFVLESILDWSGLALDFNERDVENYTIARKNKATLADAITFDYSKYFEDNKFPKQIDFLQIDLDGLHWKQAEHSGNANLLALVSLPLTQYRFSVIVFEHECTTNFKNKPIRDAQREILSALDYVLLGSSGLEDWWIDPRVIEKDKYSTEYFVKSYPYITETVEKIGVPNE